MGTGWHILQHDKNLTHLPLVPNICVSELGRHWLGFCFVACSAPRHYRNQCCFVNWAPRNKFQWNSNRSSIIFIQENAYKFVFSHNGGHFVTGSWVKLHCNHSQLHIELGMSPGSHSSIYYTNTPTSSCDLLVDQAPVDYSRPIYECLILEWVAMTPVAWSQ